MKFKKKYVIGLIVVIALVVAFLAPKKGLKDYSEKYAGADNLNADVAGLETSYTYSKYLTDHSDAVYPGNDITVDIAKFTKGDGVEVLPDYEGVSNVLSTTDTSDVEWQIDVPEAGMYQIYMEYYTEKSRGVDIERTLYINGVMPFVGADALNFTRLWANSGAVKEDNQGNQIRPSQVDVPSWTGQYFKDDLGYFTQPYTFYFDKGVNKLELKAVNEPMVIKSLTIQAVKQQPTYVDYRAAEPNVTDSDTAANYKEIVQGEDSTLRSSPSLYAIYDRSSPATNPSSVSTIKLNEIGGNAWRLAGQWIEWNFDVPEDGYYNITIKGRQNVNRGFVSNRSVSIDGKIPFAELNHIAFQYSNNWQSITLADKDSNPYQFYLTKGTHTIRLEVTLGDLGAILNDMQASVNRLNAVYRKILVLTGTNPDPYRDYRIAQQYPEVIDTMKLEYKRLYRMIDEIVAYSGQKSNQVAPILSLADQLEKFVKNPDKIPKQFGGFKNNVAALGTQINTLSEAPLDIDYITVTGTNAKPDKFSETFVDRAVHEVKSFVSSFTTDYNAVGDVYGSKDAIEVWMLSGRDQSQIMKSMIDDTFTPTTGVKVNVKLVDGSILLNSILAGKGPDVVLTVGQGDPVNYALRGAVEDLTQFPDYKEVLKSFNEAAYTPYKFNGGIYALPETQSFNMLFYRKDILDELGLQVPQTWDDLIAMLPIIQQNNMTVALPSTERVLTNVSNADMSGFLALLYQNGGSLYDADGEHTLIDNENGVKAFDIYTKFFTQYKLPTTYDFPNYFRSGQIPMGVVDFGTFNTLVVFAPEIRGLWDFTLMPGTKKADGTIDRSMNAGGACTIMLKQKDEKTKQNAWTFMKWWVGADTQVRFGNEMESVMGASARYATANIDAFNRLQWSSTQLAVLNEQRSWAVGYREVAGGYYTPRHITNAVRKVLNQNQDARETLLDYATTINEEIEKKRLEFGLDVK